MFSRSHLLTNLGAVVRQHPVTIFVIAGFLAAGIAVGVSAAPHAEQPQDFHGRTWLTTSSGDHDQLVLVNGLSGLIEGQALDTTSRHLQPRPDDGLRRDRRGADRR